VDAVVVTVSWQTMLEAILVAAMPVALAAIAWATGWFKKRT
jgi:hypothetical protein